MDVIVISICAFCLFLLLTLSGIRLMSRRCFPCKIQERRCEVAVRKAAEVAVAVEKALSRHEEARVK